MKISEKLINKTRGEGRGEEWEREDKVGEREGTEGRGVGKGRGSREGTEGRGGRMETGEERRRRRSERCGRKGEGMEFGGGKQACLRVFVYVGGGVKSEGALVDKGNGQASFENRSK